DQDEGLVRRQAAKGGGADGVGAVGDRRPREVEGGQGEGQRLGQLRRAAAGDLLGADHVDRGEGIELGPRFAARSRDDQFLNVGRRGRGGGLRLRQGARRKERRRGGRREQNYARFHELDPL